MSPVAPISFDRPSKRKYTSNVSLTSPTAKARERAESVSPPRSTIWPIRDTVEGWHLITLSVTSPYTTYTTTLLLGNPTPTTTPPLPNPTPQAPPPPPKRVKRSGLPTGTIIGIVAACVFGVLILVGVFYVYLLRARQQQRQRQIRRRGRSKSRSRSSSGTAAGEPPPPPPGPEPPQPEPPPPPENPPPPP